MKFGILSLVLAMGIILMNVIPGNAVYGATMIKDISGKSSSTNGSEYLKGVANRVMIVIGVIAGAIVAVLWIFKVAIPYFSHDSQKKAQAKENMFDAAIATLIIAMAAGGMIWLVFRWIAGV